ncbi:MAG: acyltransferase domain-containing protein [Betaproteobacteria bacterium]|nr:acyltransferase domain-containing protein [Betaproteobacteria bacterium]
MRLAVVFSGQGAQQMKHYEELSAAMDRQELPESYQSFFSNEAITEERLFQNQWAQPVITALQLSRWQRLKTRLNVSPVVVAGYSAGESASYAAAGVWSINEALAVSCVRARLMDEAMATCNTCAMAYMEFAQRPEIQSAMIEHQVYPAIVLPHGGVIVGGERNNLQVIESLCATHAVLWRFLPISVPSHTPLLSQVEEPLRQYLSSFTLSSPSYSLLAGGVAAVLSRPDELINAFAYQTCHTLDWQTCLSVIREYRPEVVLEIGPGNALASMIRDHESGVMARSLDEFHSDEAVMDWLGRWG